MSSCMSVFMYVCMSSRMHVVAYACLHVCMSSCMPVAIGFKNRFRLRFQPRRGGQAWYPRLPCPPTIDARKVSGVDVPQPPSVLPIEIGSPFAEMTLGGGREGVCKVGVQGFGSPTAHAFTSTARLGKSSQVEGAPDKSPGPMVSPRCRLSWWTRVTPHGKGVNWC